MRLLQSGGVKKTNGGVNEGGILYGGGANSYKDELFRTVQSVPGLNAPLLANTLHKSLRSTQRYLKKLTEEGKVKFVGAAKNGGYYLNS